MNKLARIVRIAVLALLWPWFLSASPAGAQEAPRGVPILVYHRFGPTVADGMTVTTATFDDQLGWLRAHDYRIIPLATLVGALKDPNAALPRRAVVITADDGHESVYTQMFPLIQRDRFPVTLFIYPSAISNAAYALTWDQLGAMRRSGLVAVQSHTYWHPNFNRERARLAPDAYRVFVMAQFTRSKEVLERRLGAPIDMLAWPFGIHDPELERWATLSGFVAGFTLERKPAGRDQALLALPRYLMTDADRGNRFAAIVDGAATKRSAR